MFQPFEEEHARAIVNWCYTPAYDYYNDEVRGEAIWGAETTGVNSEV